MNFQWRKLFIFIAVPFFCILFSFLAHLFRSIIIKI
jgi:hypothetical protein